MSKRIIWKCLLFKINCLHNYHNLSFDRLLACFFIFHQASTNMRIFVQKIFNIEWTHYIETGGTKTKAIIGVLIWFYVLNLHPDYCQVWIFTLPSVVLCIQTIEQNTCKYFMKLYWAITRCAGYNRYNMSLDIFKLLILLSNNTTLAKLNVLNGHMKFIDVIKWL